MSMLGGMQIFAQADWPKVEDGARRVTLPAHPHIVWLVRRFRWLPRQWGAFMDREFPKFRDADPLVDMRNGRIYCSLAQADAIKREVQRSATPDQPRRER